MFEYCRKTKISVGEYSVEQEKWATEAIEDAEKPPQSDGQTRCDKSVWRLQDWVW